MKTDKDETAQAYNPEATQSKEVGQLAAALVKVQSKLKPAKLDAQNPFFNSKYATLDSCWQACRELLTSNGLAVVQSPSSDGNGRIVVRSTLIHTSGEWISASVSLKPVKDDPQAAGSAITYGRRYGLCSLVGIVTNEDDDGNAATQTKKPQGKPNPQQKADQQTKKPPPRNNHTPEDKTGRRMNEGYKGNPEDQTVTIPAKFKTKPKTGKSLGYEIDGKVIFFPIGHVKSQTADEVEVTAWVADQKIDQGEIAPELVCYGDSPVSDANEDA